MPVRDPHIDFLTGDGSVERTPMPKDVPHVDELGVTSGPLKSASFFLGAFCKEYSEDFMLCRNESADPEHCLKEGRRATRCAQDFFGKLGSACGEEWKAHWTCLENNNHEFSRCRKVERPFHDCVFEQMKLKKAVPGAKKQLHEA